jgi:hypothetical protein
MKRQRTLSKLLSSSHLHSLPRQQRGRHRGLASRQRTPLVAWFRQRQTGVRDQARNRQRSSTQLPYPDGARRSCQGRLSLRHRGTLRPSSLKIAATVGLVHPKRDCCYPCPRYAPWNISTAPGGPVGATIPPSAASRVTVPLVKTSSSELSTSLTSPVAARVSMPCPIARDAPPHAAGSRQRVRVRGGATGTPGQRTTGHGWAPAWPLYGLLPAHTLPKLPFWADLPA